MATTTPNYGWAVPTSTDLVKDGATAIETLGDAIDASLVDLRGGTTGQILQKASATQMDFQWANSLSGLTLINTTSFSAVSSQSFNDVFSTTYDYYKVIASGTVSSTRPAFRLRVSGADATGSNYEIAGYSGGGIFTGTNTAFLPIESAAQWWISFDLINPFLSSETSMLSLSGNATNGIRFATSRYNLTTSFTGLSIFPEGAGTLTGKLSILGYSK